jgi:O-antigen/teichoic acid export membrane protein
MARGALSAVGHLHNLRISAVFAMSVANAVLGLAMTALLARLLGVAEYGLYSFFLSILIMLTSPLASGLRQTVLRETAYATTRGTEYPKPLWIWACKTALLISFPLAVVCVAWTAYNDNLVQKPAFIIWFTVALILSPMLHVAVGALQGMNDLVRSQAPEYIVRPTTALIFLISFAIFFPNFTLDLSMAMAFYAIAILAAATYGFYRLYRLRPAQAADSAGEPAVIPDLGRRKLLNTAGGFSAIAILQVGIDNIDIILLGLLEEPQALGSYRVAVVLSTIVSLAIIAVNTVIAPSLAKFWVNGEHDKLQRLVSFSTAIALLVSVAAFLGLLLFGEFVIWALFGAEYANALVPLLILSGGRCIMSGVGPMTSVLSQTGYERYMLAGLILAVAMNACLSLILIPLYGAAGAAIAAASAMLIFATFITISVRLKTGIHPSPSFYWEQEINVKL